MEWPEYELGQIASIVGGGTPKRERDEYWAGGIPWVTPTDLPAIGASVVEISETKDRITREGLDASSARMVPPGTVLLSSRATIGKVAIAAIPLCTNQGFANLIPKPCIDSRYLAYALQFNVEELGALAGSTTFKEVPKSALKKFRLPVPPPSEQRRIVEILDQADHLRRLRTEANTKAARILPALFLKMFGDPKRADCPAVPLSTLVDCLDRRRIPVRESARSERQGSVPYYGANGLVGCIDEALFDETLVLLAEDGGYWGPSDKSAYKIEGLSWVNNHAHVLRCLDGVDPDFLVAALCLLDLTQHVSGTTRGKLTQAGMNRIEIPAVPSGAQSSFGDRVRHLMALRERSEVSQGTLESLFAALSYRAFGGTLTKTWREAHESTLVAELKAVTRQLVEAEGDA